MSESRWPSYLMGLGILALLGWLFVHVFVPPGCSIPNEATFNGDSRNNLKQIALAFHNYLSANGSFPPQAIRSADGRPLLSWRVAILPYMEAGTVAIGLNQFHLDEPWDSEHNRALIAKMPDVFKFPGKSNLGETRYLAVVGPGTAFGQDHGATTQEMSDGLSNTIMLVEADYSIPWTQPEDLDYDPEHPMLGLGHAHKGGFNVLTADGAAKFLLDSIDRDVLRGLMTISGNEQVALP